MEPDDNLYLMVGEIRADVKTLVAREIANSERIATLEKRQWIGAGMAGAIIIYLTGAAERFGVLMKLFG